MFGMITPHPLNFLRTLESIPLGRLHDSYSTSQKFRQALLYGQGASAAVSHLDSDLPVTLVSFESLYNVGLHEWLHHGDILPCCDTDRS